MFTSCKRAALWSKFGHFTKSSAGATAIAAAVTFAAGTTGFAAIATVTGLTTTTTTGTSATKTGISGYGSSYSIFQSSDTYNLAYNGQDVAVKTVTAGTLGTYQVASLGTVTVRRSSTGGNNDILWYTGNGNGSNHSTVTLNGSLTTGLNQALSSNNLQMGADNIFSNQGNTIGNDTNVSRVDVIFSGGITASAASAFSVMDRGPSNDHDAFKIAAITSLTNGQPSGYGTLFSFSDGTWGTTSLLPTTQEDIVRQSDGTSGATFHPSDSTAQTIGGVLIQTNSLVTAQTKIYGYSLFSADVSGSGNQLVNWTNTTYFPAANAFSNGGGLDPVATLSALYTPVAVPEPTSCMLAAAAAGAALSRRPKRSVA